MLDDIIDNDWGKVRHYETETRYYIEAKYLNENLLKNAASQLNALHQAAYETIVQPFMAAAEKALATLRETVKEMNLESAGENARLALGSAEKELRALENLFVRFNKISAQLPLFGNRQPSR